MSDINYAELFEVEPESGTAEETAAESTAEAAPAGEDGETGERDGGEDAGTAETSENHDPEGAGTAETSTKESSGDTQGASGGKGGDAAGTGAKQSRQENARYAAARRQAERERDEGIARAQAEAQRVIAEVFRTSGLTNPYTKQPIRTREEFERYRERYDEEQKNRLLKKSGMSGEEFEQFVESLPQVRQAREAAAAAAAAQQQAREREAQMKVEEQLREIGELDPTIRELSDLTRMENYDRFYELVKRGNTLTDAFKLANYDRLVSRTAEAGRQAERNAAAGKAHMGKTAARSTEAVAVPSDVKEQYRMFNPDATEAEIQAHYARYHRR